MSESGQTWRMAFKGLPEEASHVRAWTGSHLHHADAPLIANELFVAILGHRIERRPAVIELTISTAGKRIRISASGSRPLPALQSHGPGALIISQLSDSSGSSTDFHSLWAQLTTEASR
ncbi:hypothetical protein ACWD9K_20010 [Streptomyces sp. 900116325]|uniref:hypothetical protein n=1 Tax=Streptomyces sp. 900116325 TaxID=3154295 RepID=UPI00339E3058